MRESIGSALLLNIVIVIVGVISAFLISSIAYSKAFKAKNRIIAVIDEYDGVCDFANYTDECANKINDELKNMGYSSNISAECHISDYNKYVVGDVASDDDSDKAAVREVKAEYLGDSGLKYCVYKFILCDVTRVTGLRQCDDSSNESHYYKVKTFMHFDIPVIGRFLEFPVTGDTRVYIDKYSNIGE